MSREIRTEIKKAKAEGTTTSTKKLKVEGSTKKKVKKVPKAAEPEGAEAEAAEPKRKRTREEPEADEPKRSPVLRSSKAPAEPPAAELEAAEPKKDSAKKPAKKAKRTDDVDEDEAAASTFQDDVRGDPALALEKFDFSADTLGALRARGVESLFPIQAATFKLIKEGKDVIGRARTGMGKTLAFGLPTIERLYELRRDEGWTSSPRALVMAPTRELAQQVAKELSVVAPKLSLLCVYGGSPMGPQCNALRNGVDLIVGTPGRLKDLNERGALALESVRIVTLDEADMMLDMGFQDDMKAILGTCSHAERQTCLFSATMPKWVRTEAPKYMHNTPEMVDLVGDAAVKASTDVRHVAIPAQYSERAMTVNAVIKSFTSATGRVIVFCDTKSDCDELVNSEAIQFEARPLHGDVAQATREKTMEAFRNGRFRVLIATDVAARGLDMRVDLVLQTKPPVGRFSAKPEVETYVHRSGRTGRAGRKGVCVTLYSTRDRGMLQQIEHKTGNKFEWTGAPSPKSLLVASSQTAIDDAAAVDDETLACFSEAAKTLLEARDGDALAALAAVLAVATGTTAPPADRSMLSNAVGYVTLKATMKAEVPSMGFVWGALRKVLPEGMTEAATNNVRGMQLTACGHGAVFDIKAELVGNELKAFLASDANDWLSEVTDSLPQLKGWENEGKGKGDGGKGGGKGGGGKGGGYGKGGGWGDSGKGKGKGGGFGKGGSGKGKDGGKGGKGSGKGKGGGKGGGSYNDSY